MTSNPQRQLFSLDHALSVPARTVLITALPVHLRSERILAQYWEDLGLTVESVSVGRNVGALKHLLADRTQKLIALESAWLKYVGNPVNKKALQAGYDRDRLVADIQEQPDGRDEGAVEAETARVNEENGRLVEITPPQSPVSEHQERGENETRSSNNRDLEAAERPRFALPDKPRPLIRTGILSTEKVDLLDHLAHQYRVADEAVRKRRAGRFKPVDIAFVTFADIGSAQIAAQVGRPSSGDLACDSVMPRPKAYDVLSAV